MLEVIAYVTSNTLREDGCITKPIPAVQLHRLQSLLYTAGTLRAIATGDGQAGMRDYMAALELVIRPPGSIEDGNLLVLRDLVIATCLLGLLASLPAQSPVLISAAKVLGVGVTDLGSAALERGLDWLYVVHRRGDALLDVLLQAGGGILPVPLLIPEKALRLLHVLFHPYDGVLPGLCARDPYSRWHPAVDVQSGLESRKITATLLLALSLSLQDTGIPHQLFLPAGSGRYIPSSLSLHLILHYLALALHPTPSTCNNIGILMASTRQTSTTTNADGGKETIDGSIISRLYYSKGLALDPRHPYLMTNLASSLKDQGRMSVAIR